MKRLILPALTVLVLSGGKLFAQDVLPPADTASAQPTATRMEKRETQARKSAQTSEIPVAARYDSTHVNGPLEAPEPRRSSPPNKPK